MVKITFQVKPQTAWCRSRSFFLKKCILNRHVEPVTKNFNFKYIQTFTCLLLLNIKTFYFLQRTYFVKFKIYVSLLACGLCVAKK